MEIYSNFRYRNIRTKLYNYSQIVDSKRVARENVKSELFITLNYSFVKQI